MTRTDNLELLLPGETEQRLDRARRWTSLMRLLLDDARAGDGGRVRVSLEEASCALDRHESKQLQGLLVELLRVFLSAQLSGTDTGRWILPAGGQGVPESCWGALEEYRAERPWLASVPGPNEGALDVARRLQSSLDRLVPVGEEERCLVEVWQARLLFAEGLSDRAGEHLEAQLPAFERGSDRVCLIACLTELHLERGAVLRAVMTLEEHQDLSLVDERLLELRSITALLKGEVTEARSIRALLPHSERVLPRSMAELRNHVPEWAALLPGPAEPVRSEQEPIESSALGRAALGAAFFAVLRPVPGRLPVIVRSEVAPGWRRRFDPWVNSRDEVSSCLERLEQEVVATASVLVVHREVKSDLRGLLGGGDTRALVLCPLLDEFGEVRAWLHLEFEHHLVPSVKRLGALGKAWQSELESELPALQVARREEPGTGTWRPCAIPPNDDPRTQFFEQFAGELGMKTARRGWWGFVMDEGSPTLIASGGGSLLDYAERPGGGRSLSRVQRCGVPIRFDDADDALSLHASSVSGVVFPISISGRAVGLFAVESERRRDFRDEDVERFAQRADSNAAGLQSSRFRSWHNDRFGTDLYFDMGGDGFGRQALDMALAGRVNEPIVLSGPAGSGKEVFARWLHFERADGAGEFEVLRAGAMPEEELEQTLMDACANDAHSARDSSIEPTSSTNCETIKTLLIKDVLSLSIMSQRILLSLLENSVDGLRIIVTMNESVAEATASGNLSSAVGSRLCRLELFVPTLSDRRGEIPGIIEFATRRFAKEFGVPTPLWTDAAMALLWRQPWLGNIRELESLIYKLVLLHPSERLDVEHVRAVARRFKLKLLKRLPSRHPRLTDLLTALRVTRKQSGNPNKTRAALYMGWDPDTLLLRLREAGIDPQNPPSESEFLVPAGEDSESAGD
ncbi:MAG: hypothetical protein ACI8TQ_002685 [Planctomycetota bacterium]|jgi:hypothetical protein